MARHYAQLSLDDRCRIAQLHGEGRSIRQIAAALDRPASTVSRELKRNCGAGGYRPAAAQDKTAARRWKGSRLERDAALRERTVGLLKRGFSPEQACAALARESGGRVLSAESIYRFIDAQIRRTKDYTWRHCLPRGKARRGCRGRRGGSSALHIAGRIPIAQRPIEVARRNSPGHWEADLMMFARYGQAILTLQERHSRLLLATALPHKQAGNVADTIARILTAMPQTLRRSITFDNGTEFARHQKLHAFGIATFFCDPYAPWQKGGIENAIGRMRRFIPRKTDLATFSPQMLDTCLAAYNNTPRKCLDWQTPAEVFTRHLLHFKCESTSPPSRGRPAERPCQE